MGANLRSAILKWVNSIQPDAGGMHGCLQIQHNTFLRCTADTIVMDISSEKPPPPTALKRGKTLHLRRTNLQT